MSLKNTINPSLPQNSQNKLNEVGNYILGKTIGEGTFGKVKLALHTLTGEKVAIKVLEKQKLCDKDDIDRVEKEIKYLKLFNHPNIIKIYEIIESDFAYYIVTEYISGGELFNYIVNNQRLNEKETSYFFSQIIHGIEEIHAHKICHRDIKPENLLLTKDKIIKIIDFGLSNQYDKYLTTPCGSPCYASPEMIHGCKYNGLSVDLWASGIILYAMVCGYLPFDDQNNERLFQKILECKIIFPSPNDIYLSDNVKDLIVKILTPNPKKRIGIEGIKNHPFMAYGNKKYGLNIKDSKFMYREVIVNYMVKNYGYFSEFNYNNINKCIDGNQHNNITTTYKLLVKQFLEGRMKGNKDKITNELYLKSADKDKEKIYNKKTISEEFEKFNPNQTVSFRKKPDCGYMKQGCNNKNNRNNSNKSSKFKRVSVTTDKQKDTNKNNVSFNCELNLNNINEKIMHDRKNNMLIINNPKMVHLNIKEKPIYKKLLKNNIMKLNKNVKVKKIDTSVSIDKSVNKKNYIQSNENDKGYLKTAIQKRNKVNKIVLYQSKLQNKQRGVSDNSKKKNIINKSKENIDLSKDKILSNNNNVKKIDLNYNIDKRNHVSPIMQSKQTLSTIPSNNSNNSNTNSNSNSNSSNNRELLEDKVAISKRSNRTINIYEKKLNIRLDNVPCNNNFNPNKYINIKEGNNIIYYHNATQNNSSTSSNSNGKSKQIGGYNKTNNAKLYINPIAKKKDLSPNKNMCNVHHKIETDANLSNLSNISNNNCQKVMMHNRNKNKTDVLDKTEYEPLNIRARKIQRNIELNNENRQAITESNVPRCNNINVSKKINPCNLIYTRKRNENNKALIINKKKEIYFSFSPKLSRKEILEKIISFCKTNNLKIRTINYNCYSITINNSNQFLIEFEIKDGTTLMNLNHSSGDDNITKLYMKQIIDFGF